MKAEEILDDNLIGSNIRMHGDKQLIINAMEQYVQQKQSEIDELVDFIKELHPMLEGEDHHKSYRLIKKHTKTMKNIKVSLRIIALFTVAIFISKIPELYPNFFGDYLCNRTQLNSETNKIETFYHAGGNHFNTQWHWGYQHYLFFLMGLALSIIQIIDIIKRINKDNEKDPK